jgi:hypothetical protein
VPLFSQRPAKLSGPEPAGATRWLEPRMERGRAYAGSAGHLATIRCPSYMPRSRTIRVGNTVNRRQRSLECYYHAGETATPSRDFSTSAISQSEARMTPRPPETRVRRFGRRRLCHRQSACRVKRFTIGSHAAPTINKAALATPISGDTPVRQSTSRRTSLDRSGWPIYPTSTSWVTQFSKQSGRHNVRGGAVAPAVGRTLRGDSLDGPANDLITFACHTFQPAPVDDANAAAAVVDESGLV